MKREIVFLIVAAILYVLPVFWQVRNLHFRLDSDYDSALPILTYIVESAKTELSVPLIFPYMKGGIPIIGDPLSFALNPLITVPAILFGIQTGLRITIFISVSLSGISMAFFLSKLAIRGSIRLWASLLYMTSGALGARIAAGHIEKILSFPFIPLFFYFTLDPSLNVIRIFGAATTLTLIIFSGDFYMVWFLTLFFFITKLYYIMTKHESFVSAWLSMIFVYILFFTLSAVKLLPFFTEVLPTMERFSNIDPYVGSIQVLFFLFPFIIPFRMVFYDRPAFQRLFGFYYNWYEYYAFISPLPFSFLIKVRSVSNKKIILLLVLIGVGALYAAVKYAYSPFYWFFHWIPLFGLFRVPQRMFTPMTPLLIGLLALCAKRWKRQKMVKIILILSVLWTFLVGQDTMRIGFEKPRLAEQQLIKKLREKDPSAYSVTTYICCMQTFLTQAHIPLTNYYYGWNWKLKNFPQIQPKYIIAPKKSDYSGDLYSPFFETDIARVWKKL